MNSQSISDVSPVFKLQQQSTAEFFNASVKPFLVKAGDPNDSCLFLSEAADSNMFYFYNRKNSMPLARLSKSMLNVLGTGDYYKEGAQAIQLSHLALAADGVEPPQHLLPLNVQCSHLCHNSGCINSGHMVWESKEQNTSRRSCKNDDCGHDTKCRWHLCIKEEVASVLKTVACGDCKKECALDENDRCSACAAIESLFGEFKNTKGSYECSQCELELEKDEKFVTDGLLLCSNCSGNKRKNKQAHEYENPVTDVTFDPSNQKNDDGKKCCINCNKIAVGTARIKYTIPQYPGVKFCGSCKYFFQKHKKLRSQGVIEQNHYKKQKTTEKKAVKNCNNCKKPLKAGEVYHLPVTREYGCKTCKGYETLYNKKRPARLWS